MRRCGSGCHNSVLAVQARWGLFYGGHLVFSSYLIYLLVQVLRGVYSVGMWCDAALSIIVRKIFSSLWQSVGRECLLRAASISCLYLSQLAIFRLIYVQRRPGMEVVFICNLMKIGRWSKLSADWVCQEHEVMREVNVNETFGELNSAFGGTLVGVSQLLGYHGQIR